MHYFIDVKAVLEVMKGSEFLRADQPDAYLSIDDQPFHVKITYQKTGFGEKPFLCCPECGCRRVKLYLFAGMLLCRDCLPYSIYRGLTHTTKGGHKYIKYRMQRLAAKNGIILKGPFHYANYPKPNGKNDDAWEMVLKKIQALENMRNQALSFNKRYSEKTIRSVLQERNILLYVFDLYDIDRYFYNWDEGYLAFPGNPNDIEASGLTSSANAYQRAALKLS
ncbi:hypothetical protein [Lacrimispora sp.]|uniref:hypothetical protein n=1 Tax=Lacrimispora sp. TaxID=2719234 RepID=UPI00289A1534|nr:hypothetical protein [Lacrimispora sp.]